jgi:hypothetical protein
MKYLMLVISGLLIAGCATAYNPGYRISQVDVVNLADGSLENLSWNVIGSDKSMNCSEVAPNAICADYFPQRRYPRAGIELSWTHADGERKQELLNPPVPAYFYTAFPLSLIIEIDGAGELNAFYRQNTPDTVIIPSG